jgi:hypothetical protein
MTGTMIISLDCEGKWGMADHIGPAHDFITERSLTKAYQDIVRIFGRFEIAATFAFVSAFILDQSQRREFDYYLQDVNYRGENWLRCFRAAEKSGSLDGWFCPQALEIAIEAGHEIASHGFSHLPFDDPTIGISHIERELEGVQRVADEKGLTLTTFVFPRNTVNHIDSLKSAGFLGYRNRLQRSNRLASLACEFNINEPSQKEVQLPGSLISIEPGYFFNWRSGFRKIVPPAITFYRWKSILDDAASSGRVAHLWLHPHNLISAPSTADVLESVLAYAAKLRDSGKLEIKTQHEHCVTTSR